MSPQRILLTAAALLLGVPGAAPAMTPAFRHLLFDPTPGSGNLFANHAVVKGDLALVGDDLDDTNGLDTGQAHLFNARTGSLIRTFNDPTPNAAFSGDRFGNAVAIDGTNILIGDWLDDTNGLDAGQAHLFDALTGSLLRTFNDPSPSAVDGFGAQVAIDGNHVLIAAPSDDSNGPLQGQVHLFNAVSGALLHTFDDPTPTVTPMAGNQFGHSISISGNNVLIADPFDDTNGQDSGQVHLFDALSGNLLHSFNDPNPMAGGMFGWPWTTVSGNNVLINSADGSAAYWFDATTGQLRQELEQSLSGVSPLLAETDGNFRLAQNVSVSGNHLLVGDPFDGDGTAQILALSDDVVALVLDQASSGPIGRSPAFRSRVGLGNGFDKAQTFVAGQTGLLASVELFLQRDEQTSLPLLLDVRAVDANGTPLESDAGSGVLGAIEIPAAMLSLDGSWVEVDLASLGIQLTAGQQLALVLQSEEQLDGVLEYAWTGSREGDYLPGVAFSRSFSGAWEPVSPVNANDTPDFYFRTFVVAIPEPSSLVLAAFSVSVLVLRGTGRRL